MSGNGQYERDVIRNLQKIALQSERTADLMYEIGKIIKRQFEEKIPDKKATDLMAEAMEEMKKYVADVNGKMKAHEWMHNLGAHWEFVNPNSHFTHAQISKDEFWELIDNLHAAGEIRPVKPEPVKDAHDVELPAIVITGDGDADNS